MAKWDFDMIPRSQANAMVAAKLTEAVDLVWRRSGPTLSKQVRALITEDAQTALAKMLAEARAKGMREAAKEAYYACGCQDNILIAADAIQKEGGA